MTQNTLAPPALAVKVPGHATAAEHPAAFKFARMFADPELKDLTQGAAAQQKFEALVELGIVMDSTPPPPDQSDNSNIPSGYTYLGQFLAHEISRDGMVQQILRAETNPADVPQCCSPTLDLDSLYGQLPEVERGRMYEADGVRMKVGKTVSSHWTKNPDFDLPRELEDGTPVPQAQVGDPRNDENLATAQTHVALIHFHNKVARWLDEVKAANHLNAATFEEVREQVIRHFQLVVLSDYLPHIVDESVLRQVLDEMRANGGQTTFFRPRDGGLYMPVEFSVAAFRFGHSMVRRSYQWNFLHNSSQFLKEARIEDLFKETAFSGTLDGGLRLKSEWIIDWRRFYDFSEYPSLTPAPQPNRAKKLDTVFDFHLQGAVHFPHPTGEPPEFSLLPVRNLIRGFAMRLPSGQQVAEALGVAERLSSDEVAQGPHEAVLRKHGLHTETPLWYYVLKEAETLGQGNRLGPVGSRLVAETFVGIIRNSEFSILDATDAGQDWRPLLPARVPGTFKMTDLLTFAEFVTLTALGS